MIRFDDTKGLVEVHTDDALFVLPIIAYEAAVHDVYDAATSDSAMLAPVTFTDVHGAEITLRRGDVSRIVRRSPENVATIKANTVRDMGAGEPWD